MNTDASYIAAEATRILGDAQQTENAVNQHFDMFGSLVETTTASYCQAKCKTPKQLTDEDRKCIMDRVTQVVSEGLSSAVMLGQQIADFSEEAQKNTKDQSMAEAFDALEQQGVIGFDEDGNVRVKEEYRNGREADLTDGSERNADDGAGRQAGQVAEGAGQDLSGQYGTDDGRESLGGENGEPGVRSGSVTEERRDEGIAPYGERTEERRGEGTAPYGENIDERVETANWYKEQVIKLGIQPKSPQAFGLTNGVEEATTYELPERLWNADVKEAAQGARDVGCNFKAVLGAMPLRNGKAVDAFCDPGTNTIVTRADGLIRDARKLGKHEIYHRLSAEDSSLNQTVRRQIRKRFSMEEYRQILEQYVLAARGIYDDLSDERVEDVAEEELLADAYAGMNRFAAADATRYTQTVRRTVQERTNRQTAEATDERTGPPQRYSFAGENAKGANKVALAHAKQMQADGEDAAKILKDTGWFAGADGKWRYEIGDAEMETDTKDTMLRNPDARRYNELFEKAYLYDEASEEELQELQILDKNLQGVRKSALYLDEIVKHDRLFEAYPALRDIQVRFENNTGEYFGAYNNVFNEIVLRSNLRLEKEKLKDTLIHEIQHAIQYQEGFAKGSNPEYWASRTGYNDAPEKAYLKKFKSLTHEQQNQWTRYQELDRVLGELFLKDGKEAEYDKYEQQQDALYERLYPEQWFKDMLDAERMRSDTRSYYRELYMNTAGEIEARDAESRRTLTDDERRETMPNTGDEDTVFAESADERNGRSYSIVEPFTDNNGNKYSNSVLLDTDEFDGISPRNWGSKLQKFVENRSENNPVIMPIYDENGQKQLLTFARKNDRIRKGGSKNRVINELFETDDNISKLAVIHIDEIVEVSEENNPYYSEGNKHGWLDKNGWLHRNAYVINAKNGTIYNLTVDIAKAEDGRTILYATKGKIKKAGSVAVNSLKIRGSQHKSDFLNTVPQTTEKSNSQFSYGRYDVENDDIRYSESEEQQEQQEQAKQKPEKLPRYVKTAAEDLRTDVMEAIGADTFHDMQAVQDAADRMAREAYETGEISEEARKAALDVMLDNARTIDSELFDDYEEVRDDLRKRKIFIPEDVRNAIPDFENIRRRNVNRVSMGYTAGRGIDQAYESLREIAPELFPESVSNLTDQLERIIEVREMLDKAEQDSADMMTDEHVRYVEEQFGVLADGMEAEMRNARRNEEAKQDERRRAEAARLAREGFDGRQAEAMATLGILDEAEEEVGVLDVGEIDPAWTIRNTRQMQDLYRQYAASVAEDIRLDEGLYWYMKQKVANGDMAQRKKAISTMEAMQQVQDFTRDGFEGTEALDRIGVKVARSVTTYENTAQMIARDKAAKQTRRMIRKAENDIGATAQEKYLAEGIASGVMKAKDIPDSVNRRNVIELAECAKRNG